MLHDATLRLLVEIRNSVFVALAFFALTFSQLLTQISLNLRKLGSLLAKPFQVVVSSFGS
jgi:hypothetical protein